MDVVIGALIVFLVAFYRFKEAPPPSPSLPEGPPRWLGTIITWFQSAGKTAPTIFPPPRANTTLFKFWLCRIVYAILGLVVYLVIFKVPGVAKGIDQFILLLPKAESLNLQQSAPVALALIVSVVLFGIPPFKRIELSIRHSLYERAAIPAQQLSERNRLKNAPYEADENVLEDVRKKLVAEGFNQSDLVYNKEAPTAQSLWTKASLLIERIQLWQSEKKYMTAFAVLNELDQKKRTVDQVQEYYDALKGDAITCFDAMCNNPGKPETTMCEKAFRDNCKELLIRIYNLLSRVSLKSHYSDHERITCMGEIGFTLRPHEEGPIPDANELLSLGIILGAALVIPLSVSQGFVRALVIGAIAYSAVLIPILIAHRFPDFASRPGTRTPAVAFPVVAGALAMLFGGVLSFAFLSVGDFEVRWLRYADIGYRWGLLNAIIAILIAWRMRIGTYPDTTGLKGIARYREWGSLRDGAIFAGCVAPLMVLLFWSKVAEAAPNDILARPWGLMILPTVVTLVIGFFVPTWYRARSKVD